MLAPLLYLTVALAPSALLTGKAEFTFRGMYVEGCSCVNACAYELTGANPGCKAVGFFSFDSGSFNGNSIAGARVAYAVGAEGWYRLYVDGPSARRRQTAADFMLLALKDFGKPESVRHLPITINGAKGTYKAQVGQVMMLQTKPDPSGKVHSKLYNKALHPSIIQAKTVSCTFKDGKRSMEFGGSNGFYHPKLRVTGQLR